MEEQYQYGPYFYQTLQHDFSSHLKIPQQVVRQFGIVPQKCSIKGPTKTYWDVSVEAMGKDMCFQEGWSVFANDHSLKEKDLLLFKYCGASKFSVKIFCKNGAQKEPSYPCFSVVMSPSYVTRKKMNVQAGFAREHLEGKQSVKLQVVGRDRVWSVKVYFGGSSTSMYGGWDSFAKDNDLRVGDVCLFNLVKDGEVPLMDVSICRN